MIEVHPDLVPVPDLASIEKVDALPTVDVISSLEAALEVTATIVLTTSRTKTSAKIGMADELLRTESSVEEERFVETMPSDDLPSTIQTQLAATTPNLSLAGKQIMGPMPFFGLCDAGTCGDHGCSVSHFYKIYSLKY